MDEAADYYLSKCSLCSFVIRKSLQLAMTINQPTWVATAITAVTSTEHGILAQVHDLVFTLVRKWRGNFSKFSKFLNFYALKDVN